MEKLISSERTGLKSHRQQRFWQILFPIVLVSVTLLAAVLFLVFSNGSHNRLLADISIIWLLFPLLFIFLVFAALAIGSIYLMHLVSKNAPGATRKVQLFFFKLENYSKKGANTVVKPVFGMHEVASTIRKIFSLKSLR